MSGASLKIKQNFTAEKTNSQYTCVLLIYESMVCSGKWFCFLYVGNCKLLKCTFPES